MRGLFFGFTKKFNFCMRFLNFYMERTSLAASFSGAIDKLRLILHGYDALCAGYHLSNFGAERWRCSKIVARAVSRSSDSAEHRAFFSLTCAGPRRGAAEWLRSIGPTTCATNRIRRGATTTDGECSWCWRGLNDLNDHRWSSFLIFWKKKRKL